MTAYKTRAEGVKFEGEEFKNLDLRSMKAFGSEWTGCTFNHCQFDLSDIRSSRFTNCRFLDCSILITDFAASFFDRTTFRNCTLEKSSFLGCHFTEVTFFDCRMAYSENLFQNVTVKTRLEINGCNLHGSNLDFREVQPHALLLNDCNLWGAKMAFGCAIFNGKVDERTKRQFLALVARVSEDEEVKKLAGDQWGVVDRLMRDQK